MRVLVTAATGDTGGSLARQLLEKGHQVTGLAHVEDARAEALRELGADVVVGDLRSLDDVRAAAEGATHAYYCYPIVPGIIEATAYFAQAASEVGIEAIVNMSQISARRDSKSHAARDHWIAERVFDWSGIGVTHLRPTFFADWMIYLSPMIAQADMMITPFGVGTHAPIAAEDQARVALSILANPGPHKGKVYPLFGPTNLTQDEIVTEISAVLGRTITHQQLDTADFVATLSSGAGTVSGSDSSRTLYGAMRAHTADIGETFTVQHLRAVAEDHRNGLFAGSNDVMTQIGGQPAMTVGQFVTKHRTAFG